MMRPSQLADLLLSPLTSDYMPFMMGRMQAAMGYHRFFTQVYLHTSQTKVILIKLLSSLMQKYSRVLGKSAEVQTRGQAAHPKTLHRGQVLLQVRLKIIWWL